MKTGLDVIDDILERDAEDEPFWLTLLYLALVAFVVFAELVCM